MNKDKKVNRLSSTQRVALTRWLDKNPGVVQFTDAQVAEKASKDLGFLVTPVTFGAQRRAQFPDSVRHHHGGGWAAKARIFEERLLTIEKYLTSPAGQRPLVFVPAPGSEIKLSDSRE